MLAPSAARGGIRASSLRRRASFHSTAKAIGSSADKGPRKGSACGAAMTTNEGSPASPEIRASIINVVQADVRHPGGVAVLVRLGNHAAHVDAVGELHAQLERPQPQVHS